MYGKNKTLNAPSDIHAKDKLNLYIYEYLYHIGAAKAAQGFCADMKWEPSKMSLGEPPGFLLSWWCVFWDLYSAAPERRDQHPHSEEAKAFHDYGFINTNGGMPPQPNGPPSGMPMNINEGMHTPGVPIFPPPGPQMMNQYPRYPNAPPRSLIRMPSQPEYPGGPGMPPQMDANRNGLRMASSGARMPTNPIGHPGPMPNAYRPRPYMTNSPSMGYSSSSPAPYGHTPTMMSSPQDTNGSEMPPYPMRNMPPGPTPMFHEQHLTHLPPEMSHHTPMNGEYDQQMKQSPNSTLPPPPAPPDVPTYSNFDKSNTDTNAILKLKESMQEEVKKFDKTPNDDDFNHFGSVG